MLTSERHMNITCICCIVAIAFQLCSVSMPGWLIVTVHGDNSSMTENHAAMYTYMCTYYDNMAHECDLVSAGNANSRFEYKDVFNKTHVEDDKLGLSRTLKIELYIGTSALAVAFFLLYRLRTFNKMALTSTTLGITEPSVAKYAVVLACMCTSYILGTLAVVSMVKLTISLSQKTLSHDLEIDFPYGLLVAALGTLLTYGVSFLLFSVLLFPCVRREPVRSLQCPVQDIELVPIQSQEVPQPHYVNPLPPPYENQNDAKDFGNQQQIYTKQEYANSVHVQEQDQLGEDEVPAAKSTDKLTGDEN